MAEKPYNSLLDERRGRWTSVDIKPEVLTILPSKPTVHWGLKLITFVVIGIILFSATRSGPGIIVLVLLLLFALWVYFDKRPNETIAIHRQPLKEESNSTYHVNEIRRFLIRENKHRNTSDDSHLLQIYMELKDKELLVLLYQDYCHPSRDERTKQIYSKMVDWLKLAK